MKVKIVGQKPQERGGNCDEYFPMAKSQLELGKYFQRLVNHSDINYAPNLLAVYCTVRNVPETHIQQTIEVDVNVKICLDGSTFARGSNRTTAIMFQTKQSKRELARYFIEDKTLICCDLTHYETSLPVLGEIIAKCEQFGLSKSFNATDPKAKKERIQKVTLGCDPEMEYVKEGNVCTQFPKVVRREAVNGKAPKIGVDGQGAQVELRPDPADNPRRLIANMRKLMKKIKKYHMSTVGDVHPLGCHIHIGVGHSWRPPEDLTHILDDFLGRHLVRLSGRARGGYAALGAVREQPHGFEYRSLPAAVMERPDIFKIVLKIAKAIVFKYINKIPIEYDRTDAGANSFEDFRAVCGVTQKEYDELMRFKNRKLTYSENVVAFWIKDAKVDDRTFKVEIIFRDTWTESIQSRVHSELISLLREPPVKDIKIILFGLKPSHGSACVGFSHVHFTTIDYAYDKEKADFAFGLSADFRKSGMGIIGSTTSAIAKAVKSKWGE